MLVAVEEPSVEHFVDLTDNSNPQITFQHFLDELVIKVSNYDGCLDLILGPEAIKQLKQTLSRAS